MTDKTPDPCGSDSSAELGPIGYLYHDAATPENAHPWLHSTMLVLAADRRPECRGETELFTRAQLEAAVAAERERLKADAADWGNALNEASWALVDAYRRHTGEVESALFFNHGKSILRDALTAYFRALGPNAELTGQPRAGHWSTE